MAKQIYIPKYDKSGAVTWYTYDASGNLVVTTAPDNQDTNYVPSTLQFKYSINGECFTRVVTECFDCTDGQWDTEACYDEAGNLATCPDFTVLTSYEKGCQKYTGTESSFCYKSDPLVDVFDTPAIFKMSDNGTFIYVDQDGNEVTELGCCKCNE